VAEVRASARALEDTFIATAGSDASLVTSGHLPSDEPISDESFRKFVPALAGRRDPKHGRDVFLQACATCHRLGNEGHDMGPDLLAQLGMGEESLLKEILLPNERIRPGYETTLVQMREGGTLAGILAGDDATSLNLVQPGGVRQVLLRKDVLGVRRLGTSLMPSFAQALKPTDAADLLGWLRTQVRADPPKTDGNQ
jgi:putative heme-binding domain-containing protein